MRKETINTFSEGLIMDLNPLVTPNNVLTNCLNGTFVTYNGNEFILQNDMGNGRVESAYLPAGYVPVGVKEHGGIIYVASYNPLNNKGQIGSFPSPERNIDSTEVSDSKSTILESQFLTEPFQSTVKTKVLNDIVIRPGDKFSIILSGLDKDNFYKLISHYDNIKEVNGIKQIKSFKNKLMNIDLGVISSSGGIKIITDQLKRINTTTGEVIEYSKEIPKDIQLNDGFWASNTKISNNLEDYRKSKSVNTYNNKLVGDLYVISSLNTIQSLDFSVYGEKINNNANLLVDITYNYNCPDGKYSDSVITDKQILGYEEDNLYSNVIGTGIFKLKRINTSNIINENITFNPDQLLSYKYANNIYTAQLQHQIPDIKIMGNSDIREYEFTPTMQYGDKQVLLEGLKVKGTINLSNLGTGIINLTTWRYYCTNNSITLTWGFEMYLKPKEEVQSLEFKFHNVKTNSVITYSPTKRYNYNGVFTDIITDNTGLTFGECYYVEIVLNTNKQNNLKFYRWLLFTGLYNSIYYSGLQDFGEDTSEMQKLRTIQLESTSSYDINSSSAERIDESNKAPITTDDSAIEGYVKKEQTVSYNILKSFGFKNPKQYPFKCDQDKFIVEISHNSTILESNPLLEGTLDKTFGEITPITGNISDKLTINYTAISPYLLKKSEAKTITYTKVLTKYETALKNSIQYADNPKTSSSIAIGFFIREEQRTGPSDRHGYAFYFMNGGSTWSAPNFDKDEYTVKQDRDGRIDFILGSGGYDKMVADINNSGNNPIFLQVCTDLKITPSQASGTLRPEFKALSKPRMLLWYDGVRYCFVNSNIFSSPNSRTANLMDKVIDHFKSMYVYQSGGLSIPNKHFPIKEGSSYVIGGNVIFNTNIIVKIVPNNAIDDEFKQANLESFITSIREDNIQQEAQKMLFSIEATTDNSLNIKKEISLYNLSNYIDTVTKNILTINDPILYDGINVYYTDSIGLPINNNYVYNSDRKIISDLQTQLIGSDYHIVPKIKGTYGSYDNKGSWGFSRKGDSYSTLVFQNVPIINYH